MNRKSLRDKLDQENVSPDAYSLEGGLPLEQYCMSNDRSLWCVYYSERGQRTGERCFDGEDEACAYMLDLLLRDPTTRLG
jgi:hypothetical protein